MCLHIDRNAVLDRIIRCKSRRWIDPETAPPDRDTCDRIAAALLAGIPADAKVRAVTGEVLFDAAEFARLGAEGQVNAEGDRPMPSPPETGKAGDDYDRWFSLGMELLTRPERRKLWELSPKEELLIKVHREYPGLIQRRVFDYFEALDRGRARKAAARPATEPEPA